MGLQLTWRDNAGIYASNRAASEFFADIQAAKGEYRLTVFPAAYDKFGRRKRGAAWKISVAHAYDAATAGFCVERVGIDTFNDAFSTVKEAMSAAEKVLRDYLTGKE